MAVKKLGRVALPEGNPNIHAYEKEVDLTAAGDSDWFLISPSVNRVDVAVNPSGGAAASVIVTLSSKATVESGAGIVEEVWPAGAVSSYRSDWVVPVTAIMLRQSGAGASKMLIRAQ